MLSKAVYSAGTVHIEASDILILFSDGINEATNQNHDEFGEDRIQQSILDAASASPSELCDRIMDQVAAFASATIPQDDRTLLIVRFPKAHAVPQYRNSQELIVEAVA